MGKKIGGALAIAGLMAGAWMWARSTADKAMESGLGELANRIQDEALASAEGTLPTDDELETRIRELGDEMGIEILRIRIERQELASPRQPSAGLLAQRLQGAAETGSDDDEQKEEASGRTKLARIAATHPQRATPTRVDAFVVAQAHKWTRSAARQLHVHRVLGQR